MEIIWNRRTRYNSSFFGSARFSGAATIRDFHAD